MRSDFKKYRQWKFYCLTLVAFYSFTIFSQQKPDLPAPPGTLWLYDSISIDKTEIANIHWLEYLYYLNQDSSKLTYKKALPDTSVWLNVGDSTGWKFYLRHPQLRYYPVVGITHSQAINYCAWRSAVVNKQIQRQSMQGNKDSRLKNYHFRYRLPTVYEWEWAAIGKLDVQKYPFGYVNINGKSSLTGKAEDYFDKLQTSVEFEIFKKEFEEFSHSKQEIIFNVTKSFKNYFLYGAKATIKTFDKKIPPNSLGLHQMIGNVAEMTIEEGIAKGGSWFHYLEESAIKNQITYSSPEAWLGFRCVCEIRRVSK